MTIARLSLFLVPLIAGAATSSLQFVPSPYAAANGVLPLPNGRVAIYGSQTAICPGSFPCNQATAPLLSLSDASGNITAALKSSALGGGDSYILGAGVDQSGNIWITGSTDSDDFPLLNPLFTQKTAYMPTGFLAKLDPNLNILFATFLGGPVPEQTNPSCIAIDSSGNAWVVGATADPGFPTTAPVFGTGVPIAGKYGVAYTFVAKISADGSKLLFSRLLGGNTGMSFDSGPGSAPSEIALDTSGNLTIAGGTTATNFPITPNVYNTGGGAYVSRISADGSQLVWSTELGTISPIPPNPLSSAQSVALDSSGNVFIAGSTAFPIAGTPGVLQPTVNGMPASSSFYGFVVKLSSDAAQLLYATNLSGSQGSMLYGLALDSSGNVWIAGNTRSPDFPGLSNVPSTGLDFALELNTPASAIQQIFPLLPSTVTDLPSFDSNASLLLLATAGNLLRLNPATALTAPAVFTILNSAVPSAAAGVAPGELLTLYGTALGPSTAVVAQPGQNGLYPTTLGGVTVQFSGGIGLAPVDAPLLYVGPGQVNLQVPFNVINPPTIQITTPTATLTPFSLPLISSIGIFGVVNPNGTVNSASNPAPVGSVVSIYLTGLGAPSGDFSTPNGAVSTSAVDAFQDNAIVLMAESGQPLATPLYAGTAPGLINGLDQINVQLPANVQNPAVSVAIRTGLDTTTPASPAFPVYTQ